jgi:hypothetical protein
MADANYDGDKSKLNGSAPDVQPRKSNAPVSRKSACMAVLLVFMEIPPFLSGPRLLYSGFSVLIHI